MLDLFAIFHLNLAYSSIEESERPDVLRTCYWPLVRLAQRTRAPIGIEASAFTLETAAALDPAWLETLRTLLVEGRCEFVGSGYAQLIGPLVPAAVNAANLRIGHDVYAQLLGFKPRIAFVNEQAYSAGMIQHYLDASYDAMVMEWDNPARAHPEWDPEWRYFPQIALGQRGERLPVIWNKAMAFQQFQRYAHDEATLAEYLAYLGQHQSGAPRALAMYGNDAEIFDFRPGRYRTEATVAGGEWSRIERLFEIVAADPRFHLIRPSQVLERMDRPEAAHRLHLESAADPTPVKKQRKYNITRWAVTGRNDLGINTACWRIYQRLVSEGPVAGHADFQAGAESERWRELCELWSSDYRTHITDRRWAAYQERLRSVLGGPERPALHGDRGWPEGPAPHAEVGKPERPALHRDAAVGRDGVYLTVRTDEVTLVLNCRRGLAIHTLSFGADRDVALCGTLVHGFYDDIHWGADFYTGMTVLESPGRPKITDLNPVEPTVGRADNGDLVIKGEVPTELGPVVKTIRVVSGQPSVELTSRLEWPEIPVGSLRLGDVTLNPRRFDRASLYYRCHNGGHHPETFPLDGTHVSHADAVSFLVSASHAIGITEGMVELGDRARTLRIEVDKTAAALVGMVTYVPIHDSYFCRVSFSAAEVDETRRQMIVDRKTPLVCRFVISAPGV